MKITLCLLMVFMGAATFSFAQQGKQKPATNTTTGGSITYMNADTTRKMDIREKLVQLAIQNPTYEVADRNVEVASLQLSRVKTKILGQIVLAGNINEFTVNPPPKDANYPAYYPRYNLGVTVPVDLFFTHSKDVKIARENLSIAEAEKNQRYRLIKLQVLSAYEDYLLMKEKLDYQRQITQDASTEYKTQEKDFTDGIIDQKEYNAAFKKWTGEQTQKIELQRDLNVKKLELEMMIGVPFDEVLASYEKDKR